MPGGGARNFGAPYVRSVAGDCNAQIGIHKHSKAAHSKLTGTER